MTPRLLRRRLALPGGTPPDLDVPALEAETARHAEHGARAARSLLDLL